LPTYHFLEYLTTAQYNPAAISYDSFMFSPDPDGRFILALIVAFGEFVVESYFFPGLKSSNLTWYLGLTCLILGQISRSLAMITARQSFNHYVAAHKAKDHVLITHGIYSLIRHPSYTGFFLWALGLQTLLANPISFVGYAVVLSIFFWDRINYEEENLIRFFGDDYRAYQRRTKALIPFV
ncbi:protein-S-isoprenylcysteine O-methyltransferase-like protein, partial [Dimargaris cristalligena]